MPLYLTNIVYLIASIFFIFGLKGLTKPKSARRGNLYSAIGMLIAIVVTLLHQHIIGYQWIALGLIVGASIGALFALFIEMTAMPQMVAIFNGFGGIASALVALTSLIDIQMGQGVSQHSVVVAITISVLIGTVTFTGSLIAFAKLQGIIRFGGVGTPWQQMMNMVLVLGAIFVSTLIVTDPSAVQPMYILAVIAALLGVTLVIPIGGADMPVVIALLNSYSGLAACATGFVLQNNVLIIAGSLVGASGFILTQIMCKAMNRSLANVIFATIGEAVAGVVLDDIYEGKVTSTSPDEVAMLLESVRKVIIVPGYGMAVAQAQHTVSELATLLESKNIDVAYGIHPVAGRMPGHMNVLLAEANVPYDKLLSMDEVNPEFKQTDVVIVIGANDVVNPLAREADSGPIAGMPILNVDEARTVIVIKRSLNPGFAGVPNPLFANDNTLMMFGDGKEMMQALLKALKEL